MAVTTPDEIYTPDAAQQYALTQDLLAMANSIQLALLRSSPAGEVKSFAGSVAPTGYVFCRGQELSRTNYARLYAVIGTTYGPGNGSTTFNVPNLAGNVPVGLDAAQTEFNALGKSGGEKAHVLSVNELAPHDHAQRVTAGAGGPAIRNNYVGDGTGLIYPQGIQTGSAGRGEAHNNLQPYVTLNWIIRT